MEFEKKLNITSVINFLVVMAAVIASFVWVQSDVRSLKTENQRLDRQHEMAIDRLDRVHQQIRQSMRSDLVNREQLDYIVIERIERLENRLDRRFDEVREVLERANIQRRPAPNTRLGNDERNNE